MLIYSVERFEAAGELTEFYDGHKSHRTFVHVWYTMTIPLCLG
jgi:hypothetical protein